MPFRGRLENSAVLDVLQILAYSRQSGVLSLRAGDRDGAVVFEEGNVIGASSPNALDLLVKAAKEPDSKSRFARRRIQVLTALRELFDMTEGDYDFTPSAGPVTELSGLDIRSFYADGPLDTGDLLLVLERAMEDVPPDFFPAAAAARPAPPEVTKQRRHERYGPIIIRGELVGPSGRYPGYLTNLSVGGTFFHADALPGLDERVELSFELPWDMGDCRVRAKVVWLRSEQVNTRRGAGLYFHEFENDTRERILSYLEQFEAVAAGAR